MYVVNESGIKYSHSAKWSSYVNGSEKEYYCMTCADPRI